MTAREDEPLPATEEEIRRACLEQGIVYHPPFPPPSSTASPQAATAVFSTVSIICGLIALGLCPPLFGIAGLVFGGIGAARGERAAPVGLLVSVVGMVVGIVIGAAVGAQTFS